jgi:hypothetical protein
LIREEVPAGGDKVVVVFAKEGALGKGGEAAVEIGGLFLEGFAAIGGDVFLVGLLLVGV